METPRKTEDEKTCASVKYIFYYEKIWYVYNTANSPKPGECSYMVESLGKSQLNLNTLLCECTSQLYEAR